MLARGISAPLPLVTRLRSANFIQRLSINTLLVPCKRFRQALPSVQALQRQYHLSGSLPAASLTGHPQQAGRRTLPALRSPTLRCRSSNNSVTGNSNVFLIIYSKPGCHLCDGLKEKVQAVLAKAMFQPSPLSQASLQIRNILDEPEWEAAYGMAIPVMTAIKSGEKEEIKIPRAPPRITADRLGDHIAKALNL